MRAVYKLFSLKTWSYISISLFTILLAGFIAYMFSFSLRIKKAGFFTGTFALLFFLIAIFASAKGNSEVIHPDRGIIVMPSVVVKSSPSLSGTDLFVLHEGTGIQVNDELGDWMEIRISDGRSGWLPAKSLAII